MKLTQIDNFDLAYDDDYDDDVNQDKKVRLCLFN